MYKRPEDQTKAYQKPDPMMTAVGQEEYEVEEVMNHQKRRRGKKKKIEYLSFWKGYPAHKMAWEPEENVENAQGKVAEYYRRIEGNASPKVGRM